jgi:hypothetical protein
VPLCGPLCAEAAHPYADAHLCHALTPMASSDGLSHLNRLPDDAEPHPPPPHNACRPGLARMSLWWVPSPTGTPPSPSSWSGARATCGRAKPSCRSSAPHPLPLQSPCLLVGPKLLALCAPPTRPCKTAKARQQCAASLRTLSRLHQAMRHLRTRLPGMPPSPPPPNPPTTHPLPSAAASPWSTSTS